MQVLYSAAPHSYSMHYLLIVIDFSSAKDYTVTDAVGTVLTHMVKLPKMLSTGFMCHNKHSNSPCYLYRQIVVFVTVKVYDSEL